MLRGQRNPPPEGLKVSGNLINRWEILIDENEVQVRGWQVQHGSRAGKPDVNGLRAGWSKL